MNIPINASDDIVCQYLTKLWNSNINNQLIEENNNDQLIENQQISKEIFRKQIIENLKNIREIGFRVYHTQIEKEVNLNINTVSKRDINKVYKYKYGNKLTKKNLMKNISKCYVFPKYKSGDTTKPENFRYLVNHHNTIKILDRLWCEDIVNNCGDNLPDPNIIKTSLIKSFNNSIINVAIKNTESIDSVVLLDIAKAFDSLEWNVLEDLLISNLTRKINQSIAKKLIEDYMIIIKNRSVYYNNNLINISKGIPTGLPSSNLVFTLAIEEIIYRWINENNYTIDKDFILNIFVDDIYLKIIHTEITKDIVFGLINYLEKYKLYINKNKSKADKKLQLEDFDELKETDYYLGIPFTRNIQLYGQLILNEFKHKKFNTTWAQIYNILNFEFSSYEKEKIILGFFTYKLKPFINKTDNISTKIAICDFIFHNYYPLRIKIILILWYVFIFLLFSYCIINFPFSTIFIMKKL